MDQTQHELTFEESIAQVMQTLPPVIRHYLGQGKYSVVANDLMKKYNLHIDQGGILEREIMLLLMGVESPDEFTQALTEEAKLGQEMIDSIVQDVNTQIFMPLREEEMKSGGMSEQQSIKSVEPAKPMMPPPPPPPPPRSVNILSASPAFELPKGMYAPPPQSPRYINQEDMSAFIHTVPAQQPKSINRIQTPPAKTSTPTSPKATQGTAIDNSRLLEDHEEPHIEFKKAQPPANLPGALSPQKPSIPTTPAQPYSVDPYREPIDEGGS